MKNEDKLKIARAKKQHEQDIVNLLIATNTKLEKIIQIHENEKIITVRGMAEIKQILVELKNKSLSS